MYEVTQAGRDEQRLWPRALAFLLPRLVVDEYEGDVHPCLGQAERGSWEALGSIVGAFPTLIPAWPPPLAVTRKQRSQIRVRAQSLCAGLDLDFISSRHCENPVPPALTVTEQAGAGGGGRPGSLGGGFNKQPWGSPVYLSKDRAPR